MPAYSFKERFVPFVLDGSKPHTIRSRRKHPAKPGDTLYLYFGLRTKHCKKLREEKCTEVRTIVITAKGTLFLHKTRLEDAEYEQVKANPGKFCVPMFESNWTELIIGEKNLLAWLDGFRPEGTSTCNSAGAFDLMLRFWKQTHDLPFIGDLISWDPVFEPSDGAYCE